MYSPGLYDEVRYNKMAEITLDNSLIKSVSPNVNYRVPLKQGLSETVKHLQEKYSIRPLDDYFDLMCDAILFHHKDFRLSQQEAATAEEYIRSLNGDYLNVIRSIKLLRRAVNIVRPVIRPVRKVINLFRRN